MKTVASRIWFFLLATVLPAALGMLHLVLFLNNTKWSLGLITGGFFFVSFITGVLGTLHIFEQQEKALRDIEPHQRGNDFYARHQDFLDRHLRREREREPVVNDVTIIEEDE